MTLPATLRAAVEAHATRHMGRAVRMVGVQPVHGGCINQAACVRFDDGSGAFLKWNSNAPRSMFRAEAEGLEALRATATVRIPRVIGWADTAHHGSPPHLVLEDATLPLADAPPCGEDHLVRLGRELAAMHRATAPRFGFHADNFIGQTPQPNPQCDSWEDFFREHRLLHMIRLLAQDGTITDRKSVV